MTRIAADLWRTQGPAVLSHGSVAAAGGDAKSLVSHHFPTTRALLSAAAARVGDDVLAELDAAAAALAGADPRLLGQDDALALVLERLLTGEAPLAVAALELAARGLSEPDVAPIFRAVVEVLSGLLTQLGEDGAILLPVVLGECLLLAPVAGEPLAALGLRRRLAWWRAPQGSEDAELVAGLRAKPPAAPPPEADVPAPAEDRRGIIIAAALAVLARGDDPTHRLIASEAGVPLASVTYYFPKKGDLFEGAFSAIVDGAEREAARKQVPAGGASPGDFAAMLLGMLPYYVSEQAIATAAHLHLALVAARTPGLRDWARQAQAAEVRALDARLRAYAPDAAPEAARALLAYLSGRVLLQMAGGVAA